jgi:hypothetical protein
MEISDTRTKIDNCPHVASRLYGTNQYMIENFLFFRKRRLNKYTSELVGQYITEKQTCNNYFYGVMLKI